MRQKTFIQKFITKCDRGLLQSASGITKCGRSLLQSASGITKCDRLLLQSASGITKCDRLLLQSASGITKCDSYYKVRRNKGWRYILLSYDCNLNHLYLLLCYGQFIHGLIT